MKKIFIIFTLIVASVVSISARTTEVTICGEAFYINGRPTYEGRYWNGHKVEGLLMNSRMVQGVFDNLLTGEDAATRYAYSDTGKWDANRNTSEFVDAMESWRDHGLLAFTLNLQGGSPMGYGGNNKCLNSAFEKDGSLRSDYMARVKLILDRADELSMVVILGYFYQGQDQYLTDEAAVCRAVDNATNWVLKSGYRNVVVEIANECDVKAYDHEILKAANIHTLISRVRAINCDGRSLMASTSMKGCSVPTEEIAAASDFILIHGNGMGRPEQIVNVVTKTRALKSYTPKPVVMNEDDNYNFDSPLSNIALAAENYVSWGYFDFRREGDPMSDGFQSVPVDWKISSARKKAFFDKVMEITNFGVSPHL
ncbi:MAG: hypothetical protein SNH35_07295 [Rikenellaceae bacterium]